MTTLKTAAKETINVVIAGKIISVICAAEMESITISAILFMMKMITTRASRNLSTRVGAEPLRDIFLRKTGNQYFYFPGPILSEVNLPSETV